MAAVSNQHAPDPGSSSDSAISLPLDIGHLRRCIVEYVDQNELKMLFWDMYSPLQEVDEMLCIQAVVLLRKMNEAEKKDLIGQLVMLVQQSRNENCSSAGTYERLIDAIIKYSLKEGVLPLSMGLEGLILTTDFTLKFGLTAEKWQFIAESIGELDIKCVRHLFRTFADTQSQLPKKISCEQRRQLIPVEKLLLQILVTVPAIFTMSELSRNRGTTLYMYPLVTERLAEIKAQFRPLADLSFVIGRSFLYPILAHPQFLASSASWLVDTNTTMLCSRFTYLPTRKEVSSPQNYLFYMVIKQPRGKESLMLMLKNVNRGAMHHTFFEGLLSNLIFETMAAVEELEPNAEIPRCQWEHLLTVIMFAMQNNHIDITGIVRVLHAILERRQYRRARDEVMWLMLQLAGRFGQSLTKEHLEKLASLYKLLYNDDVSWSCASDRPCPSRFVRFLSTACLYILLDGQVKFALPPPGTALQSQIDFVLAKGKSFAMQELHHDDAVMAVLANAYRSEGQSTIATQIRNMYWARLHNQQPTDEPFVLPYNRQAINKLVPFDMQLIDSFAMRVKLHLLRNLPFLRTQSTPWQRDRLPSPAAIDTYARFLYTIDFEFGLKSFMNLLKETTESVQRAFSNSQSQNPMSLLEACSDQLYIVLDVLCYRLTNLPIYGNNREMLVLFVIRNMHCMSALSNSVHSSLGVYSLCEQVLMREFSWQPFTEFMSMANAFLSSDRSIFPHLNNPHFFTNPPNKGREDQNREPFHVCPEVIRMLFISVMRTIKIMGGDISEEPLFAHITSVFKWTPTQMHSFPAACANLMVDDSIGTAMPSQMAHEIRTDFNSMHAMSDTVFRDHMTNPGREPSILCVIFRALLDNMEHLSDKFPIFYQILERMTSRQLIVSINLLTEYVIEYCGSSDSPNDSLAVVVRVLNTMMFHLHLVHFDRLLLSLILHPNNDHKSQFALLIVKALVDSPSVTERISFYCSTVPKKEDHPTEFFRRLGDYHRKYPEYTFGELAAAPTGHMPIIDPRQHFPVYYGSLIERLLPIVDHALSRVLEIYSGSGSSTGNDHNILSTMLRVLSPIYKYHPSPITYVFSVLHSMHDVLGHQSRARQFVLNIFSQRDETQLTQTFVAYNHQKISSLEVLLIELIERIIDCSEFILEPPGYVSQDWRVSELTPSAQALYLSCIELLASPHYPQQIVPAMVSLVCSSPQSRARPYTTLNAVALLLTALPEAYGNVLQSLFVDVIMSGSVNELEFEDIVFDNFEESVLLHMSSRAMVINAMMQTYWHHGNHLSIKKFTALWADVIAPHIATEKELWYFLRLMIPLLQWVNDKERLKQCFNECIKQVETFMRKVGELAEAGVSFEHGIELCDIFYHLKYMVTGDQLFQLAEEVFPKLPDNMREHLRYYGGRSDDEAATMGGARGGGGGGGKTSTVVRPDTKGMQQQQMLVKTVSDASERGGGSGGGGGAALVDIKPFS